MGSGDSRKLLDHFSNSKQRREQNPELFKQTTRSHSFGSSSSNGGKQPGSVNSQGEGSHSSTGVRETSSEGKERRRGYYHKGNKQKGQSPASQSLLKDGIATSTVTDDKGSATGQKKNHPGRHHHRGHGSSHSKQVMESTSLQGDEEK